MNCKNSSIDCISAVQFRWNLRFSHIYTFSGLLNSFMLFLKAMYVCIYVCVCMWLCMCENTIASKRCIWLNSDLVCILQVTVGRNLLISVNIGWIVFLQEYKKEFLYVKAYGVKFFKVFSYSNGAFDWARIWYVYYRSPPNKLYRFWCI